MRSVAEQRSLHRHNVVAGQPGSGRVERSPVHNITHLTVSTGSNSHRPLDSRESGPAADRQRDSCRHTDQAQIGDVRLTVSSVDGKGYRRSGRPRRRLGGQQAEASVKVDTGDDKIIVAISVWAGQYPVDHVTNSRRERRNRNRRLGT